MPCLVLFDFDGTLTRKDTLFQFIKHLRGTGYFFLGFLILSPILILYRLRLLQNDKTKQIVMSFFWGGTPVEMFQKYCKSFALEIAPKLIRKEALLKLQYHKSAGDDVYIVSASPEDWVKVYADSIGVKCIATRLEIKDGKVTGRIVGKNCYGPEKVSRVRAELNVINYVAIVAYGDSDGDRELLKMADQKFYRKFS